MRETETEAEQSAYNKHKDIITSFSQAKKMTFNPALQCFLMYYSALLNPNQGNIYFLFCNFFYFDELTWIKYCQQSHVIYLCMCMSTFTLRLANL